MCIESIDSRVKPENDDKLKANRERKSENKKNLCG